MRLCQCGGQVQQGQLTGNRESWSCKVCGRYEILKQGEKMNEEDVFSLADKAGLGFVKHADPKDIVKFKRFAALVAEREYERGVIDGRQIQMQSSVDKAVNAMTQPTYYIPNKDDRLWVGLTDEDKNEILLDAVRHGWNDRLIVEQIEAKLKEKNT